jgi:tetratricopeptide (TPR) repeat protein
MNGKMYSAIDNGETILFLGSNFSHHMGTPSLSLIATMLSDKFKLEQDFSDNINIVISEIENKYKDGRKIAVEQVYKMLEPLNPRTQMYAIPKVPWKAIYTLSFDSLIEKTYERMLEISAQKMEVFSDDTSSYPINDKDTVCVFKLKGCIRNPLSLRGGLVLSRSDYAQAEEVRTKLISALNDIYPPISLVFIGFNIDNETLELITQIQLKTYKAFKAYLISPKTPSRAIISELKAINTDHVCLEIDSFLSEIEDRTKVNPYSAKQKVVVDNLGAKGEVEITYQDYKKYSSQLLIYCNYEFENDGLINKDKPPRQFFEGEEIWLSGLDKNFPFVRNVLLRLKSKVSDDLKRNYDSEGIFRNKVYLVLYDHPGAGGTTLLKQLGYEIYNERKNPVVMLRPNRRSRHLDYDGIIRFLERFSTKPLFLIDNAAMEKDDFKFLFSLCESRRTEVTFVLCSRKEEWEENYFIDFSYFTKDNNQDTKETVDLHIDRKIGLSEIGLRGNAILFPLYEKISDDEKERLFNKLIETKSIDIDITKMDYSDWKKYYNDELLLVLLYKIFRNTRLEIAIIDEYRGLEKKDKKAAFAYLVICVLDAHRLKISWELLRRILDCDWSYLLELNSIFGNIVRIDYEDETNLFRARHQIIAEKIFEAFYNTPENILEIFDIIIRKMSSNSEYERNLLRRIILSKKLHDGLGQLSYSNKIFQAARIVDPSDPVVIQHLGITYMKMHMYDEAETTFKEALKYYPENPAVYNSQGILYEQMGLELMENYEPDRIKAGIYFKKAHDSFKTNIRYGRDNEHGYDRYGRFILRSLSFIDSQSSEWQENVGTVRGLIEDARDNVPDIKLRAIDSLEGKLEDKIGNAKKAIEIYEDILKKDRYNHNVRYNLAWIYYKAKEYKKGFETLKLSIEENVNAFRFYKLFSRLIRSEHPDNISEQIDVLEKAHQINSDDLEINFRLGVCYYKENKLGKAFLYFKNSEALSYRRPDRFKILDFYEINGEKECFYGTVQKLIHENRGVIVRDLYNEKMFFNPIRNKGVQEGNRVQFNIGFCFVGAQAIDIQVLNDSEKP